MRWFIAPTIFLLTTPLGASAEDLKFKDRFLRTLVEHVPGTLKHYDAATGRFGEGIWISTEQNAMLPLATVYATRGEGNTYYHDAKLLDVIMKAGDALIDDMDENGQWVFRKKDGSTWGKISMPWAYSRWIRTYALVRDQMPAERRERWVKALTLGYAYIEKTQFGHLQNIPTHHAMGLYVAGRVLDRPEWCKRAGEFLRKVAGAQTEGGYWSEGEGPLVLYNFVYIDALGTYLTMSGDQEVLPALERAIRFHAHFTYPGGQAVETIDLRNPYHDTILPGHAAFTLNAEGRRWLRNQWKNHNDAPLSDDQMALFVLYGREGACAEKTPPDGEEWFALREKGVDRAATWRKGPWFVCLSAYTGALDKSRWHQDRQNLVSIWHDRAGLIVGGGNTKLQPAWSNFTVGDMNLLKHTPGDENPDFAPKGDLRHIPTAATLVHEPAPGLDLSYGEQRCRIRIRILDEKSLEYTLEAESPAAGPVLGHVTLLPRMEGKLETKGGHRDKLTAGPLELGSEKLGGVLEYGALRLTLPETASLHWPASAHNPYRKDGRSEADEARIEIRLPFDAQHLRHAVRIDVTAQAKPG